jgi:hypothetical protein
MPKNLYENVIPSLTPSEDRGKARNLALEAPT